MKLIHFSLPTTLCMLMLALLPGCSSVKVWPFNDKTASATPRSLANATEYRCEAGKRFHIRTIDNGNAVWLIYPDREVALSKATGSTGRYTNGIATFDNSGTETTLVDGTAIAYRGCKAVTGK